MEIVVRTMGIQKMVNLDYLAGFCDGEGCFTIVKHTHKQGERRYFEYKPTVVVSNTNRKILERFKKTFKAGSIQVANYGRISNRRWKQTWNWVLVNKQATNFCSTMLNKLILKKEQAMILIKLQTTRSTRGKKTRFCVLNRQKKMLEQIRKLNKSGREV